MADRPHNGLAATAERPPLDRRRVSVIAGITLGVIVGLVDAIFVWRFDEASPAARGLRSLAAFLTPSPVWRLSPLFVTAPLVNAAVGALLGAGLGWLHSRAGRPRARLRSELMRDALALVFGAVALFVLGLGCGLARASRTPGLVILGAVLGVAALYGVMRLIAAILDRLLAIRLATHLIRRPPWRKLGIALAVVAVVVAIVPRALAPAATALAPVDRPSAADSARPDGARSAPNIVVVVIDTARADRFSAYGYHAPTTPEMDRLAAQGILFERAIAPGVWTVPTHASLLTGVPLCVHGADATSPYLRGGLATLPEVLARHGYRTAGFSNNPLVSSITGMTRGFERFEDHWRGGGFAPLMVYQRLGELVIAKWKRGKNHGGADYTLPRVLTWIDEVREQDGDAGEARPFFAFVNLMEPHSRLTYHPGVTDAFRDPRDSVDDLLRTPQTAFQLVREPPALRADDARRLSTLYDGELKFADVEIGRFVRGLEARGLLEDTLLVITADHGEAIGDHDLFSHGQSVYDEVARVPLILRHPRLGPAGTRVRTPVSTADLFQTVLRFAGIATPAHPSAAISADLLAQPLPTHPVVSEVESVDKLIRVVRAVDADVARTAGQKTGHKALYEGHLKFIARSDGERQLFDLDADPGELTNLAAARPADVERFVAGLAAWHRVVGCDATATRGAQAALTVDPTAEQALRALGYVE